MKDNNTTPYLPGIDILKFTLAVLIVAAHCSLFEEMPLLNELRGRLCAVAVPVFFAISSYLFFSKIYSQTKSESSWYLLVKVIKRLCILFTIWYILMLPMTYVKFYSVATLKETFFTIILSCCFNGYWFIKALIINTVIVYSCRKTISLWICTISALSIYLYLSYNNIYRFNEPILKLHAYYSFYYHTAYFCMGALFAKYQDKLNFFKWPISILLVSWLTLFILCGHFRIDPIYRLLSFSLLFPVFYQLREGNVDFKRLRNMSIILYMVQFVLIWLYDEGCKLILNPESDVYIVLQYSITRFVIVLSSCISISLLIINGEKKSGLAFLKYLH